MLFALYAAAFLATAAVASPVELQDRQFDSERVSSTSSKASHKSATDDYSHFSNGAFEASHSQQNQDNFEQNISEYQRNRADFGQGSGGHLAGGDISQSSSQFEESSSHFEEISASIDAFATIISNSFSESQSSYSESVAIRSMTTVASMIQSYKAMLASHLLTESIARWELTRLSESLRLVLQQGQRCHTCAAGASSFRKTVKETMSSFTDLVREMHSTHSEALEAASSYFVATESAFSSFIETFASSSSSSSRQVVDELFPADFADVIRPLCANLANTHFKKD